MGCLEPAARARHRSLTVITGWCRPDGDGFARSRSGDHDPLKGRSAARRAATQQPLPAAVRSQPGSRAAQKYMVGSCVREREAFCRTSICGLRSVRVDPRLTTVTALNFRVAPCRWRRSPPRWLRQPMAAERRPRPQVPGARQTKGAKRPGMARTQARGYQSPVGHGPVLSTVWLRAVALARILASVPPIQLSSRTQTPCRVGAGPSC